VFFCLLLLKTFSDPETTTNGLDHAGISLDFQGIRIHLFAVLNSLTIFEAESVISSRKNGGDDVRSFASTVGLE
jgi:hypothetical protein